MRFLVRVGCLLFAAACGDDGGSPAIPDAGHASDAAAASGLRVAWTSLPPIPGPIKSDIDVATATFQLARLQVVGDGGAGSGTALDDVALGWGSYGDPPVQDFDYAPVGLYSKVTLDLQSSGTHSAFEITGTVKIGGGASEPFRVYDDAELDIEVDGFNEPVQPGRLATLTVQLDLKAALEAINFQQVASVAGVRTVGPSDAMIGDVRDAIADAFRARP